MKTITEKKQRRINTDTAILDAARIEIGLCGYSNAKLSDIAKRANISIGLICQNFGSKEEMLYVLVKREIDRITRLLVLEEKADWRVKLSGFYDFLFKLFSDKTDEGEITLKFFYSLLNGYDIPINSFEVIKEDIKSKHLLTAVAEGQAKGEIKDGEEIRLLGLFYKTCFTIFAHCSTFNIVPPSKEWFLDVIKK